MADHEEAQQVVEDDVEERRWISGTDDVDDQVLRRQIDRLLVSEVFERRTRYAPQQQLSDILAQLCWEARIEVDILRVEPGPGKGEQIIVWSSKLLGALETHSFTRGRLR
jgi:hypothetical protein